MDVLTIGLMLCDIIAKPVTQDCFHQDSTPLGPVKISIGGDAINVAMDVASLGLKSGIISIIGKDHTGDLILQLAKTSGVDCCGVTRTDQHATGTSIILVEPSGERHFLTNLGIFKVLGNELISPELLKETKILSMNGTFKLPLLDDGGIDPTFDLVHETGVLTALDTTQNHQPPWLPRIESTLSKTDFFMPSYDEAVEISGTKSLQQMRKLFSRYGLRVFAVKLGSAGCYITDFKKEYQISAFPVENIADTIGAGDSFLAGFFCAYLKGMDLFECALFANATAAHCIQSIGATAGIPSFDDVLKYMKSNRYKIKSEIS